MATLPAAARRPPEQVLGDLLTIAAHCRTVLTVAEDVVSRLPVPSAAQVREMRSRASSSATATLINRYREEWTALYEESAAAEHKEKFECES